MSHPSDEISPEYGERISLWLYGLMVTGATLVAGARVDDLWELIFLVVVTNIVYYLTHLLASWVAPRSDEDERSLGHHARIAAPMVSAAFGPLAVTLVASVLGAGRAMAVLCGLVTVLMGFAGVAAIGLRRRGMGGVRILVAVVFIVSVAVLLIGAKLLVH